jgi:LuxR family maltose regulon positive regulatory protein
VQSQIGQYLALAAVEAGRLHLAYEESRVALELIKQLEGFALLNGYFEMALAQVLYQWNRLGEARDLLRKIVRDAMTWQQLDLLAWGYDDLMQVELARGAWLAAQQALQDVEELMRRESFGFYPGLLPTLRAQLRLAQGQVQVASEWAESMVFPEEPWGRNLYYAFPVVIRVYFAQQRWTEALDLLNHFSGHLDRPGNIRITITYLAQLLVALHHTGQRGQTGEALHGLYLR